MAASGLYRVHQGASFLPSPGNGVSAIGNDLVHLPGWPRHGGRRAERFREIVYTSEERKYLDSVPDGRSMEAYFWAAKEAAFKCMSNTGIKGTFNPKHYRVIPAFAKQRPSFFQVQCGAFHCAGYWKRQGAFVHGVVISGRTGELRRHERWLESHPAEDHWQWRGKLLAVQRGRGERPRAFWDGHTLPLSKSHDGGRTVFTWLDPEG